MYAKAEMLKCMAYLGGRKNRFGWCRWVRNCFGKMSGHELLCKWVGTIMNFSGFFKIPLTLFKCLLFHILLKFFVFFKAFLICRLKFQFLF